METSYMLARIFGIMMVVLYSAFLFNHNYYREISREVTKYPIVIMLSGFITLLLGVITLQVHHIWVYDWRVLITLLSWLLVVIGTVRLVFPEHVQRMAPTMLDKHYNVVLGGAFIMLLVGVFLTYKGFYGFI